jgi:hypothetical protein
MNCQSRLVLIGALILAGGGGCRPATYEPSTQVEAQQIYSRTKWRFARQRAFSKLVPELGEVATDGNRSQVFFQFASGTRLNYQELQPGGGIMTFHGLGRLEPLPGLAGPIYRMRRDYAMGNAEKVTVVGFCRDRMFRIEAQGTNELTVLQDALSLATNALRSLRQEARKP